ncbi:MAG: NAD(P)-dependent oxidoreductase [SAR324 cluster bacterium]|nr:NAD(P)-dependent oxidoreductase [SAR324 cluster bacterium]
MKILITGGAGYIGSVLVPMLLNRGDSVTVIDNFMYGQPSLLDCCHQPQLTIIRGDVRDEKLLEREVKKADAILPLACLTGAPLCNKDPQTARAVNLEAVKRIYTLKSKDQKMVFPNTNSGYGVGQEGLHCDENSPLNPVSLYGVLKVELENYLLDQGECVTFRFATVFGVSPRMRLDLLVNDFTYRALVDRAVVLFEPHFKRNYLHVRDAARVFIHAMDHYDEMKGRPFNVGLSEANLSKQELCDAIKKHLPDFHYVISDIGEDPDKRNYIVSNERIEGTGYRTSVSLDAGIQELIKGYQVIRRNQFANI